MNLLIIKKEEYSEENGLIYPSSRRITPKSKKGKALNKPLLVYIKVHKYRLTNDEIMKHDFKYLN